MQSAGSIPSPSRSLCAALLLALAVHTQVALSASGAAPASAPAQVVASGTSPAPSSERLAQVLASNKLRVCVWPDYYGITWRNPRTQQLTGIDFELAQEFARDLGVAPVFVDSSFATLADDLEASRCDIAMFAIGITEERAKHMRFSSPHLESNIYGITTRSNRRIRSWDDIDRPGVVVAVARGTYHEGVMKGKLQHATVLTVDTPFAREQAVESGRADVFMSDYPYSRRMMAMSDWARVVTPPPGYHHAYYAWAVRPSDERWYARVERFVQDIKHDGRLRAAARRNALEPIVLSN